MFMSSVSNVVVVMTDWVPSIVVFDRPAAVELSAHFHYVVFKIYWELSGISARDIFLSPQHFFGSLSFKAALPWDSLASQTKCGSVFALKPPTWGCFSFLQR